MTRLPGLSVLKAGPTQFLKSLARSAQELCLESILELLPESVLKVNYRKDIKLVVADNLRLARQKIQLNYKSACHHFCL